MWRRQTPKLRIGMLSGGIFATGLLLVGVSAVAQNELPKSTPTGGVTAKLLRYCERVVHRYDANGDGHLDSDEWTAMHGQPAAADLDGDGRITSDEFARYAANYGAGRRIRLSTRSEGATDAPTGAEVAGAADGTSDNVTTPTELDRRRDLRYFAPLPSGTPGWFIERDADGDAQLTLTEYSPRLRAPEVAEFKRYDTNGDGLLTAAELTRGASKAVPGSPAGNTPTTP